jgi:hypothetical protein
MNEIKFLVDQAPEGGYIARALGESIFTEGDTLPDLRKNVREAVRCHYEAEQVPRLVRLRIVREEVFPV